MTIAIDVSRERQCAFIRYRLRDLSALLCETSCLVSRWTRNTVDQILIEGDAVYVKAFEQQSIPLPDTETPPSRAVWPSTRPNQSPIESNNATNQSPFDIEANQSNKVLFEEQTNYQSLMKAVSIKCKLQTAECRPGIKCRPGVQTRYKMQTGFVEQV